MELMLVTGTGVSGGMWWGGIGKRGKDWLGKGGRFVVGGIKGRDEWFLMMGFGGYVACVQESIG